jgi:hypothetical protein
MLLDGLHAPFSFLSARLEKNHIKQNTRALKRKNGNESRHHERGRGGTFIASFIVVC